MNRAMSSMFLVLAVLAATRVAFAAPPELPAYESPAPVELAEAIDLSVVEGSAATVGSTVESDGFQDRFVVHLGDRSFPVVGQTMLRIRLHEANALVELDEVSKTEVFLESAKEGIRGATVGQVDTLRRAVERPGETVKGIPGGVSRLFRRYSSKTREAADDVDEWWDETRDRDETADEAGDGGEVEDGEEREVADKARSHAEKYLGVTSAERRWFKRLGADPYTSNDILRDRVEEFARVDAAGRLGTRFLQIPKIPGVSWASKIEELVWDTHPYDLRLRNRELLEEMGAGAETLDAFFDHPFLSPTIQTSIVEDLRALDGVVDRHLLLEQALRSETESDAWFQAQSLAVLRTHHEVRQPLARALPGRAAPMAVTVDNEVVIAAATDRVYWTPILQTAARRVTEDTADLAPRTRRVLFSGSVSDSALLGLQRLGFAVDSEVVHESPLPSR